VPVIIFAHDNVPPPVTTHNELLLLRLLSLIVPDTVRTIKELTVRVALCCVKVILAHVASAVTVTVTPFSIITSDVALGTLAPGAPPDVADHVETEFQLPSATAYLVWAFIDIVEISKTVVSNTALMDRSFLSISFFLI
jgi:hypothetical protein